MNEPLTFFRSAFDHGSARRDGAIIPNHGADERFDAVQQEIADLESNVEDCLRAAQKQIGSQV